MWEPAKAACTKEKAVIQQFMQEQGEEARVRPWDWRFYAEKIRQRQFELDAAELKPYFSLPSMCEALFDCAHRLFGLKFVLRADLASYHPDVQIYEVWEEEGEGGGQFLRAIFLHDNFSRSNKQGGAWMSEYRSQCRNFTADGELQLCCCSRSHAASLSVSSSAGGKWRCAHGCHRPQDSGSGHREQQ